MNQSEATVKPRRRLLTALWVSAISLWGAPKLLAADETSQRAAPWEERHQLTLLIGRLCIDENFRGEFFKSKELDKAKDVLKKHKMPSGPDLEKKIDRILKAHKSPGNPVEEACYSVESALTMARLPGFPCNPWPC